MIIKVENVYNTLSNGKTLQELEALAKKHIGNIIDKLIEKDKNIIITQYIYILDWRRVDRGEDVRFELKIDKQGRNITARQVYHICNSACLRPCYFN